MKKYSNELMKHINGNPVALEKTLDRVLNEESYERKQKIINAMVGDIEMVEDYIKQELEKKVSVL